MSVQVTTHLNFSGEARAALEFYREVFGGSCTLVTYGDLGQAQEPGDAQLIMWGQVAAENGFKVMAFDVTARVPLERGRNAFYVSVRSDSEEEAKACWTKLASGATVRQALGPAPWAPVYGMLEDRFGVVWVVDVASAG